MIGDGLHSEQKAETEAQGGRLTRYVNIGDGQWAAESTCLCSRCADSYLCAGVWSISQAVNRGGYTAASGYKCLAGKPVNRHNGAAA